MSEPLPPELARLEAIWRRARRGPRPALRARVLAGVDAELVRERRARRRLASIAVALALACASQVLTSGSARVEPARELLCTVPDPALAGRLGLTPRELRRLTLLAAGAARLPCVAPARGSAPGFELPR